MKKVVDDTSTFFRFVFLYVNDLLGLTKDKVRSYSVKILTWGKSLPITKYKVYIAEDGIVFYRKDPPKNPDGDPYGR